MKLDLYTQTGEKKGTVEALDALFSIEPNLHLVTRAVHRQQDNARQSNAHTKTRGEVKYSTRKIYRQKGTGNARHGARSANLFRSGGVTFGPRSNRNWKTQMPRKQRRIALFSALSIKAKDKDIFCLESYTGEPKTKLFSQLLNQLPPLENKRNVLIVLADKDENIIRAARNLRNTKIITVNYLNVVDCLKFDSLMFVGEESLKKAAEIFHNTDQSNSK